MHSSIQARSGKKTAITSINVVQQARFENDRYGTEGSNYQRNQQRRNTGVTVPYKAIELTISPSLSKPGSAKSGVE